jgi:DNA-binding transcriptional MerR regulator
MRLVRDTGFQLALVKEMLDANAERQEIEEKIRAVEERSKLLLENAARRDIDDYIKSKMYSANKSKPSMSASQLSLNFENVGISAAVESAAPLCDQADRLGRPLIVRVAP